MCFAFCVQVLPVGTKKWMEICCLQFNQIFCKRSRRQPCVDVFSISERLSSPYEIDSDNERHMSVVLPLCFHVVQAVFRYICMLYETIGIWCACSMWMSLYIYISFAFFPWRKHCMFAAGPSQTEKRKKDVVFILFCCDKICMRYDRHMFVR